jgi:hypothetical protein
MLGCISLKLHPAPAYSVWIHRICYINLCFRQPRSYELWITKHMYAGLSYAKMLDYASLSWRWGTDASLNNWSFCQCQVMSFMLQYFSNKLGKNVWFPLVSEANSFQFAILFCMVFFWCLRTCSSDLFILGTCLCLIVSSMSFISGIWQNEKSSGQVGVTSSRMKNCFCCSGCNTPGTILARGQFYDKGPPGPT